MSGPVHDAMVSDQLSPGRISSHRKYLGSQDQKMIPRDELGPGIAKDFARIATVTGPQYPVDYSESIAGAAARIPNARICRE